MVEVKGAYKESRYERIWWRSLQVIFKFFFSLARKAAGQPDGLTRCICNTNGLQIFFFFTKNKKSKRSNGPYSPYLQDFFTVISLT